MNSAKSIAKIAPEAIAAERLSASRPSSPARLRPPFCCNIGRNRIHADKRLSGDFGAWRGDAEVLLNTYSQLERVDRVESETLGTEERCIIANIFRRNLQHKVFDHHALNAGFEINFGHEPEGTKRDFQDEQDFLSFNK
jgi:hypothetical protein